MGLLDALLDERSGRRREPVEEAFDENLHPRVHGGSKSGEFVRKLGGAPKLGGRTSVPGGTRIPEGSGARNPTSARAPRPPARTRTDVRGKPRAPGVEVAPARSSNVRKLTEDELPKAVGRGPWSRAVAETVKALQSGEVVDTENAHRIKNADGSLGAYSPERIALHARIAQALFQGAGAHPEDAHAVFMAGGPASGKSTLTRTGAVKLPKDYVDVNPDIVRTMLPEYEKLIAAGDKAASSKTHEEASHIAKMVMNLALARHHHVVVDGTGNSGPGKFAQKIRAAQGAGHKVSVVYATIGTEEAAKRAAKRAARTGRHVPEGYLRSSHRDVTARFRDDVQHMKGVHVQVFDTHGKRPKLIAMKTPNGPMEVRDRKRHRDFIAKANA